MTQSYAIVASDFDLGRAGWTGPGPKTNCLETNCANSAHLDNGSANRVAISSPQTTALPFRSAWRIALQGVHGPSSDRHGNRANAANDNARRYLIWTTDAGMQPLR